MLFLINSEMRVIKGVSKWNVFIVAVVLQSSETYKIRHRISPNTFSEPPDMLKKISKFYCYKLKLCTPKDEKLCGYDETSQVLKYFKDKCDLYRANCHGEGYFVVSKMAACDAKQEFEAKYGNGSIQFEHVPNTEWSELHINTEDFTQTRSTIQYQSPSVFWSFPSISITDWASDWPATQSQDATKLIRRKEAGSKLSTIENELPSTLEKPKMDYENISTKHTTEIDRNKHPESTDEVSEILIESATIAVDVATIQVDVNGEKET